MSRILDYGAELRPFAFFTAAHWIPLALIILACIALYAGRKRLSAAPAAARRCRIALAFALLALDTGLYVWYGVSGHFDLSWSLPLHLCGLSLILSIVMLFARSYRLYEFLYFAGIGGALQALATPAAILSGFPHYTYYYFFIAHGGIIIACLYMTWVVGFRPTLGSLGRTMLYLNLLLLPVALVNKLTEGNYMFIARKPSDPSLIDMLGPWPWYLVSMELVALAVFALLYIPFMRRPRAANGGNSAQQ